MKRVSVYIDGSNLYHSLKNISRENVLDFSKFISKLVGDNQLVRAYYYNAEVDPTREPLKYQGQQRFLHMLATVDYMEIKLGKIAYGNDSSTHPHEKKTDVNLAVDMVIHGFRNNYDLAVLVSGDADFVAAIQAVKDIGRQVEIALFDSSISRPLREVADKITHINQEFLQECWKRI